MKIISVLWCLEGYADGYQGGCDCEIGELRTTNVYVGTTLLSLSSLEYLGGYRDRLMTTSVL